MATHGDLRRRLTALGNNRRIPGWRVAWHAFERAPAHGSGAGTFALDWERERPAPPFEDSRRAFARAMLAARRRDPDDWEYAYALAIARGAAGQDPRPAAPAALRLDPLGSETRALVSALRTTPTPAARRRAVLKGADPVRVSAGRRTPGRA